MRSVGGRLRRLVMGLGARWWRAAVAKDAIWLLGFAAFVAFVVLSFNGIWVAEAPLGLLGATLALYVFVFVPLRAAFDWPEKLPLFIGYAVILLTALAILFYPTLVLMFNGADSA